MARMPSLSSGLLYMALFGIGSVLGMATLTGLAGAALRRLAAAPAFASGLSRLASVTSIVIGVIWGGVAVGLL